MNRIATVERTTKESKVSVEINLDGSGHADVSTGVPFYDHMLTSFGVHGAFNLSVSATGDTEIDAHHTVEDVAIVLGEAIRAALGDKRGIRRFGDAWIPMDETLAHAAVDVSGRPYTVLVGEPEILASFVVGGHYPTVLNRHVFESLAFHAQLALHQSRHFRMIVRAVEVLEECHFERAEAVILERRRVFDDIRHFAALHLADDLQI